MQKLSYCVVKAKLLAGKSIAITLQKHSFYNEIFNGLIISGLCVVFKTRCNGL